MFSEIVKLIPAVDQSALRRMFQTLNQRFSSVTKKFGDGLKNAFRFGADFSLVSQFVSKLLNPLQKAEEVITRVLQKGDNAVTNAQELGTDPGKLLRLQAVAQAKGVDPETLQMLLQKFQAALATEQEAAKLPGAKPGLLHQFIGEKDTAAAFFDFVQSLSALGKTDKSRQTVVETQIFGEKIRGKASEFFNSNDFADVLKQLPTSKVLSEAANKTNALSDKADLLTAVRESQDFVTKSGLMNESQINAIDQSKQIDQKGENENLKRFDALKSTSIAVQELTEKLDKFTTDFITNTGPSLVEGVTALTNLLTEMTPTIKELSTLITFGFDQVVESIADGLNTVAGWWAEFKSSRIYKFLGGGN